VKLLAIDTSSLACTVALGIGDELIERHEEQEREHTRLLMPMIRDVLDQAGVKLADLDAIVLGNGPGSFIGMRIAASVSQGLAHGAGLRIVPVSSLAAVAAEVMDTTDAEIVAVTQDAHMQEVYSIAAGYGWHRYPQLLAANEPLVGGQSDVLYPRAAYLLVLADISAAVLPQDIQPAYLRQKVAEKPKA